MIWLVKVIQGLNNYHVSIMINLRWVTVTYSLHQETLRGKFVRSIGNLLFYWVVGLWKISIKTNNYNYHLQLVNFKDLPFNFNMTFSNINNTVLCIKKMLFPLKKCRLFLDYQSKKYIFFFSEKRNKLVHNNSIKLITNIELCHKNSD